MEFPTTNYDMPGNLAQYANIGLSPLNALMSGRQEKDQSEMRQFALKDALEKLKQAQQMTDQNAQMNPLKVKQQVFENMVKSLQGNQAASQDTPEQVGLFAKMRQGENQQKLNEQQLAALQQPYAVQNVPVQAKIEQQQLETQSQISKIDAILNNAGVDTLGAQADAQGMATLKKERNRLVNQLASTPKLAAQVVLENVKGENAAERMQIASDARIAAAQAGFESKLAAKEAAHSAKLEELGYRRTPEGNHTYIPGGKADPNVIANAQATKLDVKDIADRDVKFPKATKAVQTAEATLGKLEDDIKTLANHHGLSGMTGILAGRTPNLTGAAREAQDLYDSIIARGGFSVLSDIKSSSPNGGALGSVTDKEGDYLRAAFAPLKQTQNTESVRNVLTKLVPEIAASRKRVRDEYDLTYAYKGTKDKDTSEPQKPLSNEELINKYKKPAR